MTETINPGFDHLAPADWRRLAEPTLASKCSSPLCSRCCANDVIASADRTFLDRLRLAGITGAASPSHVVDGEGIAHVTAYGRGVIDELRLIGLLAGPGKPRAQHPEPLDRMVTLVLELLDASLASTAGMAAGLLRRQASRRLCDARKSMRELAKLLRHEGAVTP